MGRKQMGDKKLVRGESDQHCPIELPGIKGMFSVPFSMLSVARENEELKF